MPSGQPPPVQTSQSAAVLTITIAREARRNALNADVAAGIMAALDRAEADPSIRAVILTGAGDRAFCAGGDLQPDADGAPFSLNPADPRHYVPALLARMEACRLPLIARVNGAALAGGFGLMCACDLVVARDDVMLGVTEVRLGLFPMMILPVLLRAVPHRMLLEMCLTGEPLTARAALAERIVNHIAPASRLDEMVDDLVARIVQQSPTGIRLGKQGLATIRTMSMESALAYAPFMLVNMARTKDAREGFAAFNERRPAVWTGE